MIKKILLGALVIIIVVLIIYQFSIINEFDNKLERLELSFIGENDAAKISYGDIHKLKEDYLISCQNEKYINMYDEKICIKYVDENYLNFAIFDLKFGKWINDFKTESNITVSCNLAKLINNNDSNVVDKTINIDGQELKIVGVTEHDNIVNFDNVENEYVIYIPYIFSEKDTIDKLYISNENHIQNTVFYKEYFEQQLLTSITEEVYLNYYLNDLSDKNYVINQFKDIAEIVVKIVLFIIIILAIYFLINNTMKKYRFLSKSMYFKDILSEKSTECLVLLIELTIMLMLAIYFFSEINNFELYITPKWIPVQYIFDIDFYKQVYEQSKQLNLYVVSDYYNLYAKVFRVNSFICIVNIILSSAVACIVYIMLKTKNVKLSEQEEI